MLTQGLQRDLRRSDDPNLMHRHERFTTSPRTRLNGIPASSETLQKARHEAAGRTFNHLACSESKWEDMDVCRKVGTALGSRE